MFADPRRPAVAVYTAEGCSLCGPATTTVLEVAARVGADVTIVPIDGRPELERLHREHLPVVEIDGTRTYRFFVDAGDLELRLRRASRREPAGSDEPERVPRRGS